MRIGHELTVRPMPFAANVPMVAAVCHAGCSMRDPEIIETELMEISAIAEDTVKFERIVAWCATHPDEVPFALHQLLGRSATRPSETSEA